MCLPRVMLLLLECTLAAVASGPVAEPPFVLQLEPAAPPSGQAYHNNTLSSWGGNVVRDGSGRFHLFAAAMTGRCNLGSWSSNSEVVHGTADSPAGPFRLAEVALGPWHHNPQAVLHPDGTWLLYTIGTTTVPPQHKCGAESGGTPRRRLGGPKTGEYVQLHHASSPHGPWTFLNLSGDPADPGIFNGTTDNHDHGTNPTPWVRCR